MDRQKNSPLGEHQKKMLDGELKKYGKYTVPFLSRIPLIYRSPACGMRRRTPVKRIFARSMSKRQSTGLFRPN
jgi:hypothetical protein